jgi:hypothetical protein
MRKIPLSASLLTFLEQLEYPEAALSADEETADLAKPFREQIEEWDEIFKKERTGRRAIVRAEAIVAVANARLDQKTTRFGVSVLAEVGGDRKSPFFRRFFSKAPSQFVRQALRKQCEQTLTVVVAELEKLDKKHALKVYQAPLTSLAKAALAALDSRAKIKGERTGDTNDIEEWKEGCNALRLSTYAELLKIAAEKGYGRAWADSFFPSESSGVAESEELPAPDGAGEAGSSAGNQPEKP